MISRRDFCKTTASFPILPYFIHDKQNFKSDLIKHVENTNRIVILSNEHPEAIKIADNILKELTQIQYLNLYQSYVFYNNKYIIDLYKDRPIKFIETDQQSIAFRTRADWWKYNTDRERINQVIAIYPICDNNTNNKILPKKIVAWKTNFDFYQTCQWFSLKGNKDDQ